MAGTWLVLSSSCSSSSPSFPWLPWLYSMSCWTVAAVPKEKRTTRYRRKGRGAAASSWPACARSQRATPRWCKDGKNKHKKKTVKTPIPPEKKKIMLDHNLENNGRWDKFCLKKKINEKRALIFQFSQNSSQVYQTTVKSVFYTTNSTKEKKAPEYKSYQQRGLNNTYFQHLRMKNTTLSGDFLSQRD